MKIDIHSEISAAPYLGLVRWWCTSSSPWPCWRMWWTDRISIMVLWRLLGCLPLLLRGWICTRVCPSLSLGAGMQGLASGVLGAWRHCMTTFTVVGVWSRRISRTLREKKPQLNNTNISFLECQGITPSSPGFAVEDATHFRNYSFTNLNTTCV